MLNGQAETAQGLAIKRAPQSKVLITLSSWCLPNLFDVYAFPLCNEIHFWPFFWWQEITFTSQ